MNFLGAHFPSYGLCNSTRFFSLPWKGTPVQGTLPCIFIYLVTCNTVRAPWGRVKFKKPTFLYKVTPVKHGYVHRNLYGITLWIFVLFIICFGVYTLIYAFLGKVNPMGGIKHRHILCVFCGVPYLWNFFFSGKNTPRGIWNTRFLI
jgi:hypothetical protein